MYVSMYALPSSFKLQTAVNISTNECKTTKNNAKETKTKCNDNKEKVLSTTKNIQ